MYTTGKYSGNLITTVWPGTTAVFFDWFNDKCLNVWSTGINQLYDLTTFDGLWLDMNEVNTGIDGERDPAKPA